MMVQMLDPQRLYELVGALGVGCGNCNCEPNPSAAPELGAPRLRLLAATPNPFNPAMVGYVVLLISFPEQKKP